MYEVCIAINTFGHMCLYCAVGEILVIQVKVKNNTRLIFVSIISTMFANSKRRKKSLHVSDTLIVEIIR